MKHRGARLFCFAACVILGFCFFAGSVQAKETSEQKKEYIQVLSQLIQSGTEKKRMDIYATVSQGSQGKDALWEAAIMQNRAALMAEGIDALDESWKHYYTVKSSGGKTVFRSTKIVSRKAYRKRYQKIMQGLEEVLACVEPGMSDADKAMAVYYYLAKNTVYKESNDCHTGYDVLVKHTGVCDGLSNAYALAMHTLGIRCAVISNYKKDHSWNLVEIDGRWYFCDLTNGVGGSKDKAMVAGYDSCLVGVSSFLKSHSGYALSDLYGEGNSDGLDVKTLPLAQSDYIPSRSAMRAGISSRTCMFYQNGYWYWISTGNMLKKSRLDGSGERTVYVPQADQYIGWVEEYNETVFLSLNDVIYTMNYKGKIKKKVHQVQRTEYRHGVTSYFWQIAYVGRFYRNGEDTIGYYVHDLSGLRRGTGRISVVYNGKQYGKPRLSAGKLRIRAGYVQQLYVMRTSPAGAAAMKWSSSNPAVAEVDANGRVTAKKKGKTAICVRIGNKRLKCTVKVKGYTIQYKKAGINSPQNVATASGRKRIVLYEPKRNGYHFEGWYTDSAYRNKITVIPKNNRKNYILYAKWEKNV